mgnify:CR=1 FL=1
MWLGCATLIKLPKPEVVNPCVSEEYELGDLSAPAQPLDMIAGFALTDPEDPRYQKVLAYRSRFADVVLRAASLLRQGAGGEDHIDALITVTRCMDCYLLNYGASHSDYETWGKLYRLGRGSVFHAFVSFCRTHPLYGRGSKVWAKQKESYRHTWIKRAQVCHHGRLWTHTMYRQRSETDDKMITELLELALSQYTRLRKCVLSHFAWKVIADGCSRHAQSVVQTLTQVETPCSCVYWNSFRYLTAIYSLHKVHSTNSFPGLGQRQRPGQDQGGPVHALA